MRKIIVMLALVIANFVMEAQVKTPQSSPLAKIEQVVGLTTVQVEYSRPSAKGRTVYGDLVPFGKMWRTGANANTTISFSEDVKVGGKDLKKVNMLYSHFQKQIVGMLFFILIQIIGVYLKIGTKLMLL